MKGMERETSQLVFTDSNLLWNKRAGTRLIVKLGVDGHVQGMDWKNTLTEIPLALSCCKSAPNLLDLKCDINFLVAGNQPQLSG